MHPSAKPVRKCHACKLNLHDRCMVFANPREQWKRGACKAWDNEALCQKYLEDRMKHPVNAKKQERRDTAKLAQTEPHHTGTMAHTTPFVPRRRLS